MSKLAIDVNVVLTWMGFQSGDEQDVAGRIFADLRRERLGVVAPDFLLIELVNVLKWRFHLSESDSRGVVKRVVGCGIRFVSAGASGIGKLERLVYDCDLTAYDAVYLLVAQNEKCKLVTSDPKLLAVKRWCVALGDRINP